MTTITFEHDGLLVAKQVKLGEIPALNHFSKETTLEKRSYFLPRDRDAFMQCLMENMNLIMVTPDTKEKTKKNLNVLKNVFIDEDPEDWLYTLYGPQIDMFSSKSGKNEIHLINLGDFMDNFVPEGRLTEKINDAIYKVNAAFNTVEFDEKETRDNILNSLMSQKKDIPKNVLTDVKINNALSREIVKLGDAIDVWKMSSNDKQRESEARLAVHEVIVNTLSNNGHKGTISKNTFLKRNVGIIDELIDKCLVVLKEPKFQSSAIRTRMGYDNLMNVSNTDRNAMISRASTWLISSVIKNNDKKSVIADVKNLAKSREQALIRQQKLKGSELKEGCDDYEGLDDFQKDMIKFAKEGRSFITCAPTSNGKTFIGMSTIGQQLEDKPDSKICYVAPSFDLALQTYANIKQTFPNANVSLLTGRVSHICKSTDVWVGTPTHLNVYFLTQGVKKSGVGSVHRIKIDTLYIDEIHSISTNFGKGEESRLRSEAIAKLTQMGQSQIICLSATLTYDDIVSIAEMISNTPLNKCTIHMNPKNPNDPKNDLVMVDTRVVPQRHFEWDGSNYVSHTDSVVDELNYQTKLVTPEKTFKFIKTLDRLQFIPGTEELRKMHGKNTEESQVPALVFDDSPGTCYTNFIELVKYLKKKESINYAVSHELGRRLNPSIYRIMANANKARESGEDDKIDNVNQTIKERIVEIRQEILEAIKSIIEERATSSYVASENNVMERMDMFVLNFLRKYDIKVENKTHAPVELWDMITTYNDIRTTIKPIFEDIGSYYRVGKKCEEIEDLKAMLGSSVKANGEALKKEMLDFCEAERIDSRDVKPLFQLIIDGISFGIGIILPVLPFVVHFRILRLLKARAIPFVFSSYDVSMGINYPIRTVCIRSNKAMTMNVSEYLQMAGRSGRRRYDYCGIVISWNIVNAKTATQKYLPHIILPKINNNSGLLIKDPYELAVEIDTSRSFSLDSNGSGLANAIQKLGYVGVKEKKSNRPTLTKDFGNDEDYDGDLFTEEDEEKFILDKKKKEEKKNAIQTESIQADVALASALAGCIVPLISTIDMKMDEMIEIVQRIQNITMNSITDEMRRDKNKYMWAEKIGICKKALQELHTRLSNTTYEAFLSYIVSVYEVIHRTQFRQMQLS